MARPAKKEQIIYRASPTLTAFHKSDDFVRGVRGPVGSGKSTAMCWEIRARAARQAKAPDGKRYTRWCVVRNSYRELLDSTVKTWLEWNPERYLGPFKRHDMVHHLKYGDIDCEVMFRALDRPEDVGKLLSVEYTGAWINEARELPAAILDTLTDRIGRYPGPQKGGPTWRGVFMDTNAPDDDHWWYKLENGLDRKTGQYVGVPQGWSFYVQPPGLIEIDGQWQENPAHENAENLRKLEPHYYLTRAEGKTRDYILVYYCNQFGFVQEGKPVYPEYLDHVHCAKEPLQPIKGVPIHVGVDWGLTPAATLAQRTVTGRWIVIDELVTDDMGAVRFAEEVGRKLRSEYADFKVDMYGDPAGDQRSQVDERTPFEVFRARGLSIQPAPTNDWVIRREAVATALSRMVDGGPQLIISPKCAVLRKGMAGGYAYKRIQVSGAERYHDKPDKGRFSHVCEALQYGLLGAGEGQTVIRGSNKPLPPIRYIENAAPC